MANMDAHSFGTAEIRQALGQGWALAGATRAASSAYAGIFTLIGAVIIGGLLSQGFTPFIVAAAGAFMLIGPALLAGFFGIAQAFEDGQKVGAGGMECPEAGTACASGGTATISLSAALHGFAAASRAVWVIALVTALLFMIFITDAAILYSYMVGATPVWLTELVPATPGVMSFLTWGAISGAVIAFLIFCVAAFSVPLLCENRASLVTAIVASVRTVFGNFVPAMLWALLLSSLVIGSILLLPLLPITLPWLAFASRALYRHVFPVTP